jgi:hypothetical protein
LLLRVKEEKKPPLHQHQHQHHLSITINILKNIMTTHGAGAAMPADGFGDTTTASTIGGCGDASTIAGCDVMDVSLGISFDGESLLMPRGRADISAIFLGDEHEDEYDNVYGHAKNTTFDSIGDLNTTLEEGPTLEAERPIVRASTDEKTGELTFTIIGKKQWQRQQQQQQQKQGHQQGHHHHHQLQLKDEMSETKRTTPTKQMIRSVPSAADDQDHRNLSSDSDKTTLVRCCSCPIWIVDAPFYLKAVIFGAMMLFLGALSVTLVALYLES